MTMVPKPVAWVRVLADASADLKRKTEELKELKGEVDRLNQFVVYVRDVVIATHQRDLFPFMGCRTAREAIRTYFEMNSEPARVPDIARTLIDGGYTTSAQRFNETVRMALLRMEAETEVTRNGVYWCSGWDSDELDHLGAGSSMQHRKEAVRKLIATATEQDDGGMMEHR